ncbi:MAG: hypothetical protein AAB732_01855 [Patescibacteria group bacterium]
MKYLDFSQQFKDYPVITYQNIRNVFQKVNHSQLINWRKKGWLLKLKRGIFVLPNKTISPHFIANKLNYSYISLEYALSYYQIIPDVARIITSVSKNRSEKINNNLGNFYYYKINGLLFTGFTLIKEADSIFRLALPEKALFDLIYFRADLKNQNDLEEMRLNISKNFNIKKIEKFTKLVKSHNIKNRLKNLIAYLYTIQ